MTTAGKWITLLIIGAIILAAMTHAPGFSMATMAGGSVLDQTLLIESGNNVKQGSTGTAQFFPSGSTVSVTQ